MKSMNSKFKIDMILIGAARSAVCSLVFIICARREYLRDATKRASDTEQTPSLGYKHYIGTFISKNMLPNFEPKQ